MWREQAITEWSWHVNSIFACCRSARSFAHMPLGISDRNTCISKWLVWHHKTTDSPPPLCHKPGDPLLPLVCDVIYGRPLRSLSGLYTVVCLRQGKRDACLGPPFATVMCKAVYLAFKGAPTSIAMYKWATLLSKGPPKAIEMCKYLAFKGAQSNCNTLFFPYPSSYEQHACVASESCRILPRDQSVQQHESTEKSGLRDVKRADFIRYWRRPGLKSLDKPKIL